MLRNIHNMLKKNALMQLALASGFTSLLMCANAQAKDFQTPEVLMLGDSQLSFGTGQEMIRFFDDFENRCERHVSNTKVLNKITQMRKTLIGARSTTLRSWSAKKGGAYDKLCEKDPDWGVNASIWGHMRDKSRRYIQIGETENFDFCKPFTPPMSAMFQEGYDPKLLLINVLGNAASKWSGSPKGAELDLKGFLKLIPEDLPCVYIATMPTYTKKRNARRFKAQNNLKKAMDKLGNRCTFVKTLDANTIGAIQSKAKYFRRHQNGKVKDPFHPQRNAAELVLKMKEKQVCQAVLQAVLPYWGGGNLEVTALSSDEDGEKAVKASLVTKVAHNTNAVEEVKAVSAPKVVSDNTTEVARVTSLDIPKKETPKVVPVFLWVKTLPDGEGIENHKMAIQTYIAPTNPLDKRTADVFDFGEEQTLNATWHVPETLIRGSVDLHFTNGETSTKLVEVKPKSKH